VVHDVQRLPGSLPSRWGPFGIRAGSPHKYGLVKYDRRELTVQIDQIDHKVNMSRIFESERTRPAATGKAPKPEDFADQVVIETSTPEIR